MSTITAALGPLPTMRVAQASATAPGFGPENIGPVVGPLFEKLAHDLAAAGVTARAEGLARYEALDTGHGSGVLVHVAFPVGDGVESASGFDVVSVPGVELAATFVHHGPIATIGQAWESLHGWIVENGYELSGVARERYIVSEPEPQQKWVTELQQPITRR